MALFGFKSKKEVEEEKRFAAQQAAQQVVQNNMTNLSNLSKGSQVKFAVPYFDVFDPRFMDQGVPVAVHGMIVYSIDDMDLFHQINKNEAFSDETFQNKLRGQVTKYVKGVVANAPAEAQIPVLHLERKILEISELVQKYVTPKIEQLFAISVRSLDITSINIDKESPNYRQLKALTSDLERNRVVAQNEVAIDSMRHQNELNKEMSGLQSVEMLKMQMEDQRERMRIQRETLPKANIVGMTTLGPIGPETEVPRDPMITLVYFEDSGFSTYLFDCHETDPREAGKQLCEKIAETDHVQGVLLLTACAMIVPTPVIEELEARYPDISVFGAQAGTEQLGNDQSMVFTSHEICDRGILAVVFYGEDLHIKTDYNLGWRPIGREMTVTEMGENGYVKTIDYEPAIDVYHKYLDVEPDDAFYYRQVSFTRSRGSH